MTFQQEFSSWFSPLNSSTAPVPSVGSKAPQSSKLQLKHGKSAIVTFLRHAGCPFAEKTYLKFREVARTHHDIDFYAVSHSDENATQNWLKSLPQSGSESSNLKVVVDHEREAYSAWGLGASSAGHFLSPSALWDMVKVGREEGIWNRPTESGSRWQTSGFFAIDADGVVRWGRKAEAASDVPDFENAVKALS